MNKELLRVALRQQALMLPERPPVTAPSMATLTLVGALREQGFGVSEPLLHALAALDSTELADVADVVADVTGTKLNWTPLVRGWQVPTGESVWDHFVTLLANVLGHDVTEGGTTLPCGHFIPSGTFPLERYTGCPFCGRPFELHAGQVNKGQGSQLRVLSLWTRQQLTDHYRALLSSPVPLDATQRDSLTILLRCEPMPDDVDIVMKETRMLAVDALVSRGDDDRAATFFSSPADVLRYLWYRHTGKLQLLEPRTLYNIARANLEYEAHTEAVIDDELKNMQRHLRLSYDRTWCRRVARWLNGLGMPLDEQLATMHPKREMWVRFIRALRLAEYARRKDYGQLQTLLDRFYRRDYSVFQGQVDRLRRERQTAETLALLSQRPGLFARCLFSTMLWFGPDVTLEAFRKVLPQVAPRLLVTLGQQAELWFSREQPRVARPLSGRMKTIEPHQLLRLYSDEQLSRMATDVAHLYLEAMRSHFAQQPSGEGLRSIYIDPQLSHIPLAVGDRSSTLQDASAALQGTRFPVEGDEVRLFMLWGEGLPAQPLDMDLSCYLLTDDASYHCAYFNLTVDGAQHSGDIRQIPDQVGAAEYVELRLPELEQRGVRRVVFTCNAYTPGRLSPNLRVGWMNSRYPMTVSDETGVAYDPSTVQHSVRVADDNLAKGLIFGVLDVPKREITWLEIPFDGQTVLSISPQTIEAYLTRLSRKITIGQALSIMAEAQHLAIVDAPDVADRAFTLDWAKDTAAVSQLLLSES